MAHVLFETKIPVQHRCPCLIQQNSIIATSHKTNQAAQNHPMKHQNISTKCKWSSISRRGHMPAMGAAIGEEHPAPYGPQKMSQASIAFMTNMMWANRHKYEMRKHYPYQRKYNATLEITRSNISKSPL